MRIGFDTTALAVSRSGVGVYTENLLNHLPQACNADDSIVELTHRHSPRGKINKTLWMQIILPYMLWHDAVDVCHFTNSVAPLCTRCPTVLTIHDMTLWLYPEYHFRKRLLAMRPFIPMAARRARAIIAVSENVKADIVRILGIPAGKVHVVYSAPSDQFRRLPPDSTSAVRRKYGLPEQFILYVGTIEPRKNLVRLLEAFASLPCRPPTLVMVGARGWKDQEVFAAVERFGLQRSVCYLGYVPLDELIALYQSAGALIQPSLYEGFGLPVLEAMACGCPVIASDLPTLREVAKDAAVFVAPNDVTAFARAMRELALSGRSRAALSHAAAARAATFSWGRCAEATLEVYRDAVGAR
ncbi:MAG: glycosyltransferase family 4 protein [Chthoniobacterales bacterium]